MLAAASTLDELLDEFGVVEESGPAITAPDEFMQLFIAPPDLDSWLHDATESPSSSLGSDWSEAEGELLSRTHTRSASPPHTADTSANVVPLPAADKPRAQASLAGLRPRSSRSSSKRKRSRAGGCKGAPNKLPRPCLSARCASAPRAAPACFAACSRRAARRAMSGLLSCDN